MMYWLVSGPAQVVSESGCVGPEPGVITGTWLATLGHLFWRRTMARVDNSNSNIQLGHIGHITGNGKRDGLHFS